MGRHSARDGQDDGHEQDDASGGLGSGPAGDGPSYGGGSSYGPAQGGSTHGGDARGSGAPGPYGRFARGHGTGPAAGSGQGTGAGPGVGPASGAGPDVGRCGPYRSPVPPGAPGTGRRRRSGSPEDTGGFAVISPRTAGGPPQSHPEHREHGAWGHSAGWSGVNPGLPGGRHDLARDPVEEWAEDWAPYDTAHAMRAQAGAAPVAGARTSPVQPAGRLIPRPRQEFVDAFDAPPEAAPAPSQDGAGDRDADGGGPAGPEHGSAPRGGKGRTLSGAAAAAVVTVLAVVVGGQVAGEGHTADPSGTADPGGAPHTGDGPASRSGLRPTAAPATTTAAPTYADLMAEQYPLDPQLKLSGAFATVPGHQAAPGKGKVMRFRVDTEKGLPLDPRLFSDAVFTTLNDSRSWGHGGTMTFERVSSGPADIVITLASPGTTAAWCARSGLDTSVENVSCDAASTPRTMINAFRWAQGAATYGPSRMLEYRQMLINHEVGHRLGHNHTGCPKQGALAPVMMQQTKFLSLDGGPTCRPNAWPFP